MNCWEKTRAQDKKKSHMIRLRIGEGRRENKDSLFSTGKGKEHKVAECNVGGCRKCWGNKILNCYRDGECAGSSSQKIEMARDLHGIHYA